MQKFTEKLQLKNIDFVSGKYRDLFLRRQKLDNIDCEKKETMNILSMPITLYENEFYEVFKKDQYSQNGEDGVIAEILKILDVTEGWVCEFGAWNGYHFSNTFSLIEKGFKGVFIESDLVKFKDLLITCATWPNITPIHALVDHNENAVHSLDKILQRTNLDKKKFILLSIDIDSFDYQVWASFKHFRPLIVVIEINSALPPNKLDEIHGDKGGAGFAPMFALARSKGYSFLCHSGNMIFIVNELAPFFEIPKNPFSCFRRNWLTDC